MIVKGASRKMALQTFRAEFGEHEATLTAILVGGEPWFRGNEAAAALGYKKPRNAIGVHVDDEDKTAFENLRGCPGGPGGGPGAAREASCPQTPFKMRAQKQDPARGHAKRPKLFVV